MDLIRQISKAIGTCRNRYLRKVWVRFLYHLNRRLSIGAIAVCLLAAIATGCITPGETIRISGEIVDVTGARVPEAEVVASASKRGGSITGIDKETDKQDQRREADVQATGDGTFTASSRWAGTLTLSVPGYKIKRVDELGTTFLVPTQSFFQSQDHVRLEVVKDE